jgi:TPP-dependent pyruvate/acetoin dehydrogenase alpha subunit
MFDPDLYRSKQEISEWKVRCPIESFKKELFEKNILDLNMLKNIQQEIEIEFKEAVKFAEASEYEPIQDLEKDVYYENKLQRGPSPSSP